MITINVNHSNLRSTTTVEPDNSQAAIAAAASRAESGKQGCIQGWKGVVGCHSIRCTPWQDGPVQAFNGAKEYPLCRQVDLPIARRPSLRQEAVYRQTLSTCGTAWRNDQQRVERSRVCTCYLVARSRNEAAHNSPQEQAFTRLEHCCRRKKDQTESLLTLWRSAPRAQRHKVHDQAATATQTGKPENHSWRSGQRNQTTRLFALTHHQFNADGFGQVTESRVAFSRSLALGSEACPPSRVCEVQA